MNIAPTPKTVSVRCEQHVDKLQREAAAVVREAPILVRPLLAVAPRLLLLGGEGKIGKLATQVLNLAAAIECTQQLAAGLRQLGDSTPVLLATQRDVAKSLDLPYIDVEAGRSLGAAAHDQANALGKPVVLVGHQYIFAGSPQPNRVHEGSDGGEGF